MPSAVVGGYVFPDAAPDVAPLGDCARMPGTPVCPNFEGRSSTLLTALARGVRGLSSSFEAADGDVAPQRGPLPPRLAQLWARARRVTEQPLAHVQGLVQPPPDPPAQPPGLPPQGLAQPPGHQQHGPAQMGSPRALWWDASAQDRQQPPVWQVESPLDPNTPGARLRLDAARHAARRHRRIGDRLARGAALGQEEAGAGKHGLLCGISADGSRDGHIVCGVRVPGQRDARTGAPYVVPLYEDGPRGAPGPGAGGEAATRAAADVGALEAKLSQRLREEALELLARFLDAAPDSKALAPGFYPVPSTAMPGEVEVVPDLGSLAGNGSAVHGFGAFL